MLLNDLPPYKGSLLLLEQARMYQGKSPQATAAIVDSQEGSNDGTKGKCVASTGGKARSRTQTAYCGGYLRGRQAR